MEVECKNEEPSLLYMIDRDFWTMDWDWIKTEEIFGEGYLRYD